MAIVRIVITFKSGVLDAQGQAVEQGLRALGYDSVTGVRVGKYIQMTMPDDVSADEVNEMCIRFLANPLIEDWRIETGELPEKESHFRVSALPRSRGLSQ